MSDLVIDVRQVSSYPELAASFGTETVLLQQGGLGGPYASISTANLVATALNDGPAMGIGVTPPGNASGNQLFVGALNLPPVSQILWDAYLTTSDAEVNWTGSQAASFGWQQSVGWNWATAPIAPGNLQWFNLMLLDPAGSLHLPLGTLTVARDPAGAFEVATANWVSNNTVHSFNNRNGQVILNASDVYAALKLCDPLATQPWVQSAINASIQNLLYTCPFVNRWNGRQGQVYLMLSDITCVFYQSGQQPISPTPLPTSNDDSIATTAFVAQALAGEGGFLPLSGGTMTGGIRGMADQNLGAGAPLRAYEFFTSAISGVNSGGDGFLSVIQTTSDTVDAGGGGLVGQYINLISGGPGTSGNRLGQYIETQFSGSTLDAIRGYPSQYGGQWIYAYANGNAGGTSMFASRGQLWGGLASATLQAGATFWSYAIGMEINVGVSTGASAPFVQALKIVPQNHNQISNATDYLIGTAKVELTDQGFANGIVFGSVDGYWPITTTGTLIGTQASNLPTPPPMVATNGVDFSGATFSGAAFKSIGFSVDGSGNITSAGHVALSILGTSGTDTVNGIQLYSGYGFNAYDGAVNVAAGGSQSAAFMANGVVALGSPAGPTLSSGPAAPTSTQPNGSIYLCTGGAVGTHLYVSAGGGVWNAVAGV